MEPQSPHTPPPDPDTDDGDQQDAPTASVRSPLAAFAQAIFEPPHPRRVGKYTIKGYIDSGNMGSVYLAVQQETDQLVAVKLMNASARNPKRLQLFRREAQLLGRLQHPNIARVYDTGTHDDGGGPVPFFALEYVPGAMTVTRFVEHKKLRTRDRLALFAKICDAVHHGHQKSIIHRDLKPSNILVARNGEPKIIDFGVARAADSDRAQTTVLTNVGALIGTVPYMSPEQCGAASHDIDTRSDVYSLGVVLYEVLCGHLPYRIPDSIVKAAQVIQNQPPTRMSSFNRALRGDIETIARTALAKDPDRRYQSAAELARDIRRYLGNEPIEARPPSTIYRVRRFAKRNTAAFVTMVTLMVSAPALFMTTVLAVRSTTRSQAQQEVLKETNDALATQSSLATIAAANGALRAESYAAARQHLSRTPESGRNSWEWLLLSGQCNVSVESLEGSPTGRMAISPSKDTIAYVRDKSIHVFDTTTRQSTAAPVSASEHCAMAFGPHRRLLLSTDEPGLQLLVHDALDLSVSQESDWESPRNVRAVAFSPDGDSVAWSANRFAGPGRVSTRQLGSGATDQLLASFESPIVELAYDPMGRFLACAALDKTIKLIDVTSGKVVVIRGLSSPIAFHPNGKFLAATQGRTVHIVHCFEYYEDNVFFVGHDSPTIELQGHRGQVHAVAFSPDGELVCTGSADQTVRLWDADLAHVRPREPLAVLPGHTDDVRSVAFGDDNQHVYSSAEDGTIRVWRTTEQTRHIEPGIRDLALRPKAAQLAIARTDHMFEVRDLRTWEVLFQRRVDENISAISYSADGAFVAVECDSTVLVWHADTGAQRTAIGISDSNQRNFRFGPSGSRLITTTNDGVEVWDARTSTKLFSGHSGSPHALWLDDSTIIIEREEVSKDPSGEFQQRRYHEVWDIATSTRQRTVNANDRLSAVSPDGRWLACLVPRGVGLLDAATGHQFGKIEHSAQVHSLTFSPDSSRLVCGLDDGSIAVWDPARLTEVLTLRGHTEPVIDLAFSDDGTRLASASSADVRFWDAISRAERHRSFGAFAAARDEAAAEVDRLLNRGFDDVEVVQLLLANQDLTPPVRDAALHNARVRLHQERFPLISDPGVKAAIERHNAMVRQVGKAYAIGHARVSYMDAAGKPRFQLFGFEFWFEAPRRTMIRVTAAEELVAIFGSDEATYWTFALVGSQGFEISSYVPGDAILESMRARGEPIRQLPYGVWLLDAIGHHILLPAPLQRVEVSDNLLIVEESSDTRARRLYLQKATGAVHRVEILDGPELFLSAEVPSFKPAMTANDQQHPTIRMPSRILGQWPELQLSIDIVLDKVWLNDPNHAWDQLLSFEAWRAKYPNLRPFNSFLGHVDEGVRSRF